MISWWIISISALILGMFGYFEIIFFDKFKISRLGGMCFLVVYLACGIGQMAITLEENKVISENEQLIRKYSFISRLTCDGGQYIADGHLGNGPNILNNYQKFVKGKTGGRCDFSCSESAKKEYQNIIKKEPEFPFTYLALSNCLSQENNPQWKEFAQNAVNILKETTSINGRAIDHDIAYQDLWVKLKK